MINIFLKIQRIFKFKSHDTSTSQGLSDERYRRIILTGASSVIVKIFTISINLITVPLTVNYLGAERYGLWMTISSILVFLNCADLGLGNGLINAIAKANGSNNIKDAQIAVSSTFFMLLWVSFFLFLCFIISYPFLSWHIIFNVKSPLAISESGPTMMVLIITFLINLPLGIIQKIQDGYQEGFRNQLWLIFGSCISIIGLLVAISFKAGLPLLVLALSGGQVIATIANGTKMFARERQNLLPKLKYFDFEVSKKLINTGLIFLILGLLTLVGASSDNIVIAHMLGASSVAEYEIVKKIFMTTMITQFVIQPLWPAFGEAMYSGDFVWIKKTLKKALLYSIGLGAIVSLPLLLFGKQIITIWVGEEFAPDWSLLLGFYLFVFLSNYGGVISTFLNSDELVAKQTIIVGFAATTSIVLKIYLSSVIGTDGVIWATIIAYSLFYILPTYRLAFNFIDKKIKTINNSKQK
jgi:O-antigen/teichoic acid export membrane protein